MRAKGIANGYAEYNDQIRANQGKNMMI